MEIIMRVDEQRRSKWPARPVVITSALTVAIIQTIDMWVSRSRTIDPAIDPAGRVFEVIGSILGSLLIGALVSAVIVLVRNRLAR